VKRVAAWTLVALATLAGCATTPEETGPAALVGCYQFERNEGARALNLPWGFDLEEAELDVGLAGARLAVSRLSATRTADHPFRYWTVQDDGTIRVGYPGRGAYHLELRAEGRALVGQGWDVGDVLRPGETLPRPAHHVVAQRVLCPDASDG
jgi:hypothetical protein